MEWIKLKDQMPKEGQEIVVLFEYKGYDGNELLETDIRPCIGKYYKDDDWLDGTTTEVHGLKVESKAISWIPIPKYDHLNNNNQ